MYQTYKNTEPKKEKKFEERLIPKEVVNPHPPVHSKKASNPLNDLFSNMDFEDILILGLLLLLYYEDCRDNMLMIILVALLFIKD